jgi:hypothetical protein
MTKKKIEKQDEKIAKLRNAMRFIVEILGKRQSNIEMSSKKASMTFRTNVSQE